MVAWIAKKCEKDEGQGHVPTAPYKAISKWYIPQIDGF